MAKAKTKRTTAKKPKKAKAIPPDSMALSRLENVLYDVQRSAKALMLVADGFDESHEYERDAVHYIANSLTKDADKAFALWSAARGKEGAA
jgi:hypothetical protein